MGKKDTELKPASRRVQNQKLIDLRSAVPPNLPLKYFRGTFAAIERLLAIDKINAIHRSIPTNTDLNNFCRASLDALGVDYNGTDQELSNIPANGPLVMVANHPFGGIEGIILAELLLNVRPDVRILGNYLLTQIPALRPSIIAVDPVNPKKAAITNARALKKALDWVCGGGALLAFPAGEVSHFNLKATGIIDPPWSPHIAKIVLKAKAKVLPVHIHGRNTAWFNIMGMIHPRLRTMMLLREMTNKRGATIQLTIGKSIPWRKLTDFNTPQQVVAYLRLSTDLLKHRRDKKTKRSFIPLPSTPKKCKQKPIIAPISQVRLAREVASLPENNRLVNQKAFRVYITTAERSPAIMREIGRLREISFRDAGEGTGQSLDIDGYDDRYLQLFLWNSAAQEIVGAYRIGQTDTILQTAGPSGLYSTKLFNYKPQFYDRIDNSLELGRSFIRTEYQRKFGCLAMLWRGIGEFVARNCRYRHLFGPVSISQNYHTISKNLMVAFLLHNSMDPNLAPMVKPRKPFKIKKFINHTAPFTMLEKNAIDEISMLVSKIEKDNKGVPTLIKHYLKLSGRFLAFNLDKTFANVIDGLVWVDLIKTDPKLLKRFMGRQGVNTFYAYHEPDGVTKAA
ncbi:MAG: lysophospholipid acyltransferase family protein [Desulfobacteraceae bacterium]|jgi:putative hemolysin